MNGVRAIVLAAGKGTRMKSARPKMLHALCGRPMLWYVLRALHDAAVTALGLPAVLKTAGFGYDGKGQRLLRTAGDVDAAWTELSADTQGEDVDLILEAFVSFESELSVVAARTRNGDFAAYPVVRNEHVNHILPDLKEMAARRLIVREPGNLD